MKILSESEREEVREALVRANNSKALYTLMGGKYFGLLITVIPILDYAKAPQNFPDPFIETQALNNARAING